MATTTKALHEWVEALQLAWEHDGGGHMSGEGYARLNMPIGTPDEIPSHIRDCGPSESHVLFSLKFSLVGKMAPLSRRMECLLGFNYY
jgi:hypothetical protein